MWILVLFHSFLGGYAVSKESANSTVKKTSVKSTDERCPSKPPEAISRLCPVDPICNKDTAFKWVCDARCPEKIPLNCQAPICNIATGYQWECDKRCSKFPTASSLENCESWPICGSETDYEWKCQTKRRSSPLCGTEYKPGCNAVCIPKEDGRSYGWKCLDHLTKEEVLDTYDLYIRNVLDIDGNTVEVVYQDADFQSPIEPTSEHLKQATSLGTQLNRKLNNPPGFINQDGILVYDTYN